MLVLAATNVLGTMFWLAILFFIIAIVAWLVGARGVAGASEGMARTLLFVFLILAVILMILNFTVGAPSTL